MCVSVMEEKNEWIFVWVFVYVEWFLVRLDELFVKKKIAFVPGKFDIQ